MKILIAFVAATLALNGALALPAGSPHDDAEVIDVPRRRDTDVDPGFKDFKGVVDTGVGYPFLQPNPLPFSFNLGFFDSFEDIFRRLRARLWPVELTGERSGDDNLSGESIGLPFDPKKGNTTSTVKVVDGHKIEVNETVYGDGDNVFRVRVVNIRPVDSDEDGAETPVSNTNTNNANPSTSAPPYDVRKYSDEDSDERREPLEKKPDDNEIRGNIDDPEHSTARQQPDDTMLPTTTQATTTTITTNEDNAANLNAAFVTDNSLEEATAGEAEAEATTEAATAVEVENGSGDGTDVAGIDGNIEAETNKSVGNSDNISISSNYMLNDSDQRQDHRNSTDENNEMENHDAAAAATDLAVEDTMSEDAVSRLVDNEQRTIENNEETEVNDNLNESSHADAEAKLQVDAVAVADADADAAATTALTKGPSELALESSTEYEQAHEGTPNQPSEWTLPQAAVGNTYEDVDNADKKRAIEATNKHREDISSSDDEDEDGDEAVEVEMNPTFNAEWENLTDDLAKAQDSDNELGNEIDAYDAVPIDLSNDIAVNEIAAANPGFPLNPDAEFVSVDGVTSNDTMPRFEKLSLSAAINPTSYQPASVTQDMK